MRWSRLFDDLEAQLLGQEQAGLRVDSAERTRFERGRVDLVDRWVACVGRPVVVRVAGAGEVVGTVQEVGRDWVVLQGRRTAARLPEVLLPQAAVLSVTGLGQWSDQDSAAACRRLDLRQAVRALSRDRAVVVLTDRSGALLTGTIDRVGLDHLDLADHAADRPRRVGAVRAVHTVPFAALALVRQI